MIEELFIIRDGVREKCDLSTPSGITLNYESNIFNALDKVNCSRSYTFSLPKTMHNMAILGAADDVRSDCAAVGIRMRAEFRVNGVNICPNANIYLSSVDTAYKAVMTWNVIEGLEDIKNNDVDICELETDAEKASVDETENIYFGRPDKNSGLRHYPSYECGGKGGTCYPLPVIPIDEILDRINERYAAQVLMEDDGHYIQNDILDKGCIPCVKQQLNEAQQRAMYLQFDAPSLMNGGTLQFLYVTNTMADDIEVTGLYGFQPLHRDNWSANRFKCAYNQKLIVEGKLVITGWNTGKEPIKFQIFQGVDDESTVVVEAEREYDGNAYTNVFNFTPETGTPLEISVAREDTSRLMKMRFVDADGKVISNGVSMNIYESYIRVYSVYEEGGNEHPMDMWCSMPELSCFTLLKSLYSMMGAFPVVLSNGAISACCFSELYRNANPTRAYNWSKAVINAQDNPKEITWKVGDFAQKSYYCMKSDAPLEAKTSKLGDDEYADGILAIETNSKLLDKAKIAFQVPFNAPYIKNGKNPLMPTGETFKYWEYDGDPRNYSANEGKAIYGMLDEVTENETTRYVMTCWNGFNSEHPEYAALQRIVRNPHVMKCELNIDEVTLNSLDYARPVYLSQYASYFAIIKITRKSDGTCEAELIRLNFE